jgi:NTP pyrophosphatase (non-canonical NTP hydrolase)
MSDPTYQAQRASFLFQLAVANELRCPDFEAGGLMDWSPAERGNELAGETGEACNELKKLLRFDKKNRVKMPVPGAVKFVRPRKNERALREDREAIVRRVRMELGDVIICASLIARQLGINLEAATREKFNATSDKIGSAVKL